MAQVGTQVDESSLEMHPDTLSPETAISAESVFLLGSLSAGSKSDEKISSPFVAVWVAAAMSPVLQKIVKIIILNFSNFQLAYLAVRQQSRDVATMHPLHRQHIATEDGGVAECLSAPIG